ncbi:DUF2336 domain-containing protein [Pararhizobium antarcticum]|uniref:DUF2336 domain-containing protein n=1 Tax=Pararhizobium antarcticum TaxID=1798805 RepID=A0A657LSH1_9HYPH|nr:DUF2336 domain-containing protein [Pararhizobium antarcticum]OJF95879.1 hypothetical protein AX760_18795 [Pararhizobium antarcticum]OJF99321.1 hypothetical protein AX761_11430 [Rhizobium sp. 58]
MKFCVRVGVSVSDRFRELERPQSGRLKDVVLMATVTGFEGLRHPRKSDMKQFSELFEPLFQSSSDEARRQAAAALSQCPHLPEAVALQIGSAQISIAAIFLTRSTSIADETLIAIIRSQSPAHSTAIARREDLSPQVVDTLVERRQTLGSLAQQARTVRAAQPQMPSLEDRTAATTTARDDMRQRQLREESLRRELKALALTNRQAAMPVPVPVQLAPIGELPEALLVRFARSGEANLFAFSLSASLDATPLLGERIVLDVSGQQLAATLSALLVNRSDQMLILQSLYPHLAERIGGTTRAEVLIDTSNPVTSRERVEAWLRADRSSTETATHAPHLAADRTVDPRQTNARPVATEQTAVAGKRRSFGR